VFIDDMICSFGCDSRKVEGINTWFMALVTVVIQVCGCFGWKKYHSFV